MTSARAGLICTSLIILLLFLSIPRAMAQQVMDGNSTGLPEFASFHGSNFDLVSMQNGNLHIQIPILNLAQRAGGAMDYRYIYDVPTWQAVWFPTPTTANPQAGFYRILPASEEASTSNWRLVNPTNWHRSFSVKSGTCPASTGGQSFNYATNFIAIDPDGTKHPFPMVTAPSGAATSPVCGSGTFSGPALDGSGMFWDLASSIIKLKNGNSIISLNNIEDTNGNQYSSALDTGGRSTPLVVTNVGTGPQYTTWVYQDSQHTDQKYRVDYTSVNIQTSMCGLVPHVPDPPASPTGCLEYTTSMIVPVKLTLPDLTYYQFAWVDNSVAELQSVQLPTGAVIAYTYNNLAESVPNSGRWPLYNIRKTVGTRTVTSDSQVSQWTYTVVGLGLTVQNPDNSTESHSMSRIGSAGYSVKVETQIDFKDSTGTLKKSVVKNWTGELGPDNSTDNLRVTSETTTLDSSKTSKVETDYETPISYTVNGCIGCGTSWPGGTFTATRLNVAEKREFDYGASPNSGALLRKTDYTYLHTGSSSYTNLNIVDRVTSVLTYDGSGSTTPKAKTLTEYDVYSHSSLPMQSSGAVQHDSAYTTSYLTRGNATATSRWRNTDGTVLTTVRQFDDAGNVVATQDPNGNVTHYDYTDNWADTSPCVSGQSKIYLKQVTDPLSHTQSYNHFSCTGGLASVTDQNTQTTSFTYDGMNRLTTRVNPPGGGQATATYTPSVPPSATISEQQSTTPMVNVTRTLFSDQSGRLAKTTLTSETPAASSTVSTYDIMGRPYQQYNPTRCASPTTNCGESTWGVTTTTYDGLGRPQTITRQDGSTIGYAYNGPCTTITDEASKSRQSCTDALGRLVKVAEDPAGSNLVTEYQYDALDNLTRVDQWGGAHGSTGDRVRTFTYDSLSRLLCASNPENSSAACPTTATSTYTPGTVGYSYDANGNLKVKTSPAPNQTSTATVAITYCYDALNRMTAKAYTFSPNALPSCAGSPPTFPSPAATYTYDVMSLDGYSGWTNTVGRLVRTTTTGTFVAKSYYDYDAMGRVQHLVQCVYINCGSFGSTPGWWVIYNTFDLLGHLTSYSDANGHTLTQTFDSAGRPAMLSSNWNDTNHPGTLYTVDATAGYTPGGVIKKATFGNSLVEARLYNSRLQPCHIILSTSGALPPDCSSAPNPANTLDFMYDYHSGSSNNGNIYQWNAAGQQTFSRAFTYDSLNRIQSMTESAGASEGCKPSSSVSTPYTLNWSVDPWGNRTAQAPNQGSCSFSQVINAKNQIAAGSYDAAGNLLGDGIHDYSYDAENRIQYVDGGTIGTYVYDADGRRVAKSANSVITYYVYGLDGNVLTEFDGSGNWAQTHLRMAGKLVAFYSGASTGFYHQDHLGSTRLVTLPNASVYDSMDFLPYGEQIAGGGATPFKFTDKERDSESGLDNFPKRYLTSSMGRWMSPDPLPWLDWQHGNREEREHFAEFISNPQNFNMYAYVDNNPVSKTDPTGMEGCQAGDKKFQTCTIKIVYDPKTSKGTLTVLGQNKGDKNPTVLLTSSVVVGGDGHVTPTGTFTATVWEKDHVSTKYGNAANTPWSKTVLGGNAFGPYQLHMKELDSRGIYIHGTMGPGWSPSTWGNSIFLSPTSHGCVRMCNRDDIALHDMMPNPSGNKVIISTKPEDED